MIFNYDDIIKKVAELKNVHGTNNPFDLCNYLHIPIIMKNYGTESNSLKGLFTVQRNIPIIVLNVDLPEVIQRLVLAHELGHALLHRNIQNQPFINTYNNYTNIVTTEKEANFFSAELLIDDDDLEPYFNGNVSIYELASILGVPPELIDYKVHINAKKTNKTVNPAITSNATFLGNIPLK